MENILKFTQSKQKQICTSKIDELNLSKDFHAIV